jgi:hypothetical protein
MFYGDKYGLTASLLDNFKPIFPTLMQILLSEEENRHNLSIINLPFNLD